MYTKFELKTERVKCLSFHHKCYWILVAFHSGSIRLYDYVIETLLEEFKGHGGPVRAVSFHKTLPLFVSGGDDYLVKVWDWQQKRCLFDLKGHADYVRTTFFHNESPWIVSASDDQTVRIWNWQSRSCIAVLTGHNHYVMCAQFHPVEDLVISASLDQTARVWNLSGLKNSNTSNYSPASEAGEIRVPQGILDSIISIDFGVKFILEGHENGVNWAEFHPKQPLIVTTSDDKTVRIWRISGSQVWETDVLRGHAGNVSCATFHPTQDLILSNSEDKTLKVWNTRKKVAQCTIKRDNSRFWSIVRHPNLNIFAAGHDNGFFVFKLERERPAFCNLEKGFIYVDNRNIRLYDYSSKENRVLYVLPSSIKSTLGTPHKLSYNPSERAFLLSSSNTKCMYQMFSFRNHDFQSDGVPNSSEIYRGIGSCAIFISKNRIALLDKTASQQVLIKDMKNVTVGRIAIASSNLTSVHHVSGRNILVASSTSLYICDTETNTTSSILSFPNAKKIYISPNKLNITIISPKRIAVVNPNLEIKCSLHTDTNIKSGTWYNNDIFIFNNAHHIKYLLPNGDSGVLLSIMTPIYLIRIIGNTLTYITSKLEVNSVELDFTECVFKYNVIMGNNEVVQQMVASSSLVGQSIIGYLREKGHSDIPLDFIKDPGSKFDMAISCKNFNVALDTAKELDDIEVWEVLGQEALKYRNIKIAETAFQKSKNLQSLNVLYLVTGNMENLSKMIPIYISLNDYSSAYVNALIVGDTALQIDILSKTKKPFLSYLTAKSSNKDEVAMNILEGSGIEDISSVDVGCICKDAEPLGIGCTIKGTVGEYSTGSTISSDASSHSSAAEVQNSHPQAKIASDGNEDLDLQWDLDSDDGTDGDLESAHTDGGSRIPTLGLTKHSEEDHVHQVTLDEAMDYFHEVMKTRGVIINDKLESHMGEISAAFQPVEIKASGKGALSSIRLFEPLLQHVESTIETAMSLFDSGRFNDSLVKFRDVLLKMSLVSLNCENDEKIRGIIRDSALYVLGLSMEVSRRYNLSSLSPKRNLELAYYLIACVKTPNHRILTLRSAMTVAKSLDQYKHVNSLAKKILSMDPGVDISKKINNLLSSMKKNEGGDIVIDFDCDNPSPICCSSFTTISDPSKISQCRYCKSDFLISLMPEICSICNIGKVEAL